MHSLIPPSEVERDVEVRAAWHGPPFVLDVVESALDTTVDLVGDFSRDLAGRRLARRVWTELRGSRKGTDQPRAVRSVMRVHIPERESGIEDSDELTLRGLADEGGDGNGIAVGANNSGVFVGQSLPMLV